MKQSTRDYFAGKTLRAVMFGDMAKGGYFQIWVCNQEPRLTRSVTAATRKEEPTTTWMVDGEPVADLDEAADKLLAPVAATAVEA